MAVNFRAGSVQDPVPAAVKRRDSRVIRKGSAVRVDQFVFMDDACHPGAGEQPAGLARATWDRPCSIVHARQSHAPVCPRTTLGIKSRLAGALIWKTGRLSGTLSALRRSAAHAQISGTSIEIRSNGRMNVKYGPSPTLISLRRSSTWGLRHSPSLRRPAQFLRRPRNQPFRHRTGRVRVRRSQPQFRGCHRSQESARRGKSLANPVNATFDSMIPPPHLSFRTILSIGPRNAQFRPLAGESAFASEQVANRFKKDASAAVRIHQRRTGEPPTDHRWTKAAANSSACFEQ